jgi:hypothetical protein
MPHAPSTTTTPDAGRRRRGSGSELGTGSTLHWLGFGGGPAAAAARGGG